MPWYLLINETEPRWRLHDTVDAADLEQSLTINGKNLDRYLITQENDPDPAKTRSRYEAAGF